MRRQLLTAAALAALLSILAWLYLSTSTAGATPRSAVTTTVASPGDDVRPGSARPSSPATDSSVSPLSGVPQLEGVGSALSGEVAAGATASGTPPEGGSSGVSSGIASWYRAAGDVASVPWWRAGMDPVWAVVDYIHAGTTKSVTVLIVGKCGCYVGTDQERAIDLSDGAFLQLAPLGEGTIPVTITIGVQGPALPATEAAP